MIIRKVPSRINKNKFIAICKCDYCGKLITKKYSQAIKAEYNFCDKKCWSNWRIGKHPTEEIRRKISIAGKGRHHTEEAKRKISLAVSGKNNPNYGKHHTKEARKKISQANKGKKLSEETKEKIRLSNIGEKNANWKGGRNRASNGYILIYKPKHPFATKAGYIAEHRLIMEKYLNRYLTKEEVVHHINEIIDDNRIENLMLFDNSIEHTKYHDKLLKV